MRSVQGKALEMPFEDTILTVEAKKLVGLPEGKSGLLRTGNAQRRGCAAPTIQT
jgi:hypothetical protein